MENIWTLIAWLNPLSDVHYNLTSRWMAVLILLCTLATLYRLTDIVFS